MGVKKLRSHAVCIFNMASSEATGRNIEQLRQRLRAQGAGISKKERARRASIEAMEAPSKGVNPPWMQLSNVETEPMNGEASTRAQPSHTINVIQKPKFSGNISCNTSLPTRFSKGASIICPDPLISGIYLQL